ncbi:protein FAM193B isoform X2 [Carcharodon carcharias]|uniref:protein FAM193B isoform X2 n=1 Tax=Carcharodon carcharias TaxID=13397 RepID=UPI001B7E7F46|nr:protein FAM193B isoform X2 [Carcharodon carcharias]
MSCAEEKRVAGRRKKNKRGSGNGGSSSSAVPGESRSPSPAEEAPSPAQGEQPRAGMEPGPGWSGEQSNELMNDGFSCQLNGCINSKLKKPSLAVHQPAKDCCLLCHHERKDWGTQQNGIVDLKKLAHSVPALTHGLLERMPLWICQTCQRRVEEEEQRAILEQTLTVGQGECQAHNEEVTDDSVRTMAEGDAVSNPHRLPTEKCHHSTIHCCHQVHRQTLVSNNPHQQQLQQLQPCTATPNGTCTKESSRVTSDCSRSPSCVSVKTSSVQCKNMSRRPTPPGGEFHCSEDHRYSVLAAPPNSPTGLSSHQHPLTAPKSPPQVINEPTVSSHQHGHATSTTSCTMPHTTVTSTNSNRRPSMTSGISQVLPHIPKTSAVAVTTAPSPDVSLISKTSAAVSTGVLVTPVPPSASPHISNNGLASFPKTTAASPICTSHYNGACPVTASPNLAAPGNGVCRDQSCKSRLCTNETAYSPTQMHNADESLEEDDSCSEHSSCTSHTANQKEGKYCDCCYCEFFGHGPPPAAPTSRNYTEIREKLRTRLTKRKEELPQKSSSGSIREPPVDERNVEDLLNYINSSEQKPVNSAKAAKRARHKQKKEKARSEVCDQRPEKPCPSTMHIQDLEKVSVINQHIQEGIEEKVLIFNQHVQEDIEEKVSKLNQHMQDDIEEKLNQQELWHQVELQRVSSILTTRLEQLKDRIRDSIKANFNLCDLPKDDFPELTSVEKGLLIDSNGIVDKEETRIIDHQKLNLNLSLTTPGIVQNHLLNGNKHAVTTDDEHNGSDMVLQENSLGKKSKGSCSLPSKAENISTLRTGDAGAVVLHKPTTESKMTQQTSRSGKQPRQPRHQTSEETKGKTMVSRKEHEYSSAPKMQSSKQHVSTAKHKTNQNHDGKSVETSKTMIAKYDELRQGKWKGVSVLGNSETGDDRKCNTKISSTEKVEGSETRAVKEEQQMTTDLSQSKGKNKKGKKKKHDKTNNCVALRTDEHAEGQDSVMASPGIPRPKHSDDVFLPKDIDLDSVEMDETDREVEHFKRFCLDSAKQTRPKVSVNWSNFSLKKGPSTAH